MREGLQVKICGIKKAEDAELAVKLGAEFLGFIFHPKSPRALDRAAYRGLLQRLPPVQRVYVQVRPEPEELRAAAAEGFDFFQLHFAADESPALVEAWAGAVSPEKLWLAPRIAPDQEFPAQLLPFAETFLIDTYRKGSFGGTGETGDWGRFREWAAAYSEKRWVLAGGLNPENVVRAVEETGASIVDVSSGIEAAPGEKDHGRMKALFTALG